MAAERRRGAGVSPSRQRNASAVTATLPLEDAKGVAAKALEAGEEAYEAEAAEEAT